jgi:TonB family protein
MRTIVIVGALLLAMGAALGAQDLLSTARDQYASAAYEDALSTLNRLDGDVPPEVARQADEYRAFCLYALGRTGEAESVAESIIRKQPTLARLAAADASPRLESMFSDVRKRLLPSLIRERYRVARAAVDQKSFASAELKLADARSMIAEAEKLGVEDDGLPDLSVLVDGFLQLIRSTADQKSAAPAAVAAAVTPAPATPAAGRGPAPTGPRADAAAAQLVPAATNAAGTAIPDVYSAADEGVTPPIALEQKMPTMTAEMQMITRAVKGRGMVDIVIDETGRVIDASVRQSLNPAFDTMVVRAARNWKYRPALVNGTPVRFLKTFILVP